MQLPDFASLSNFVTREEHQLILAFIEQTVSGAQAPMDVEADAIIRALFVRNPDAAYRMTMRAMSLQAELDSSGPVPTTARQRSWLAGFFDRRESPNPARRVTLTSHINLHQD